MAKTPALQLLDLASDWHALNVQEATSDEMSQAQLADERATVSAAFSAALTEFVRDTKG